MKSKINSILIVSITMILMSLILISSGLSKPKPNPNTSPELIIFEGDLEGNQELVGCCPNAGPFPEYTMTLSDVFPEEMSDEHVGHLFMNVFMDLSIKGVGNKKAYIVQFWWTEGGIDYFIEIIGGDINQNRKMKILTVTFNKAPCKIWIDKELTETVQVDIILTREQL